MIKQNGFIIFRKFYCFYKIYVFDKQNLSSNNKTFVSKITKFHFPKNKTKFIIGNKRILRVYISCCCWWWWCRWWWCWRVLSVLRVTRVVQGSMMHVYRCLIVICGAANPILNAANPVWVFSFSWTQSNDTKAAGEAKGTNFMEWLLFWELCFERVLREFAWRVWRASTESAGLMFSIGLLDPDAATRASNSQFGSSQYLDHIGPTVVDWKRWAV